jgi:DNA-binding GntR family transcriptional regulator
MEYCILYSMDITEKPPTSRFAPPQRKKGLPIQRQTVVSATLQALRERILRGELLEGEQLRQEALAEELGVSRIPLREALRQLQSEGLVTFYPHRGAVVSTLSPEEISEAFELRAVLEPDLLRRAIPNLSEADFAKARSDLAAYEADLQSGDVSTWGERNWQFHSTLLEPAHRPLSLGIVQNLNYHSNRYVRLQLMLTHGETRATQEHQLILAHCEKRETDAACSLLIEHILHAGRSLVEYLRTHRRGDQESKPGNGSPSQKSSDNGEPDRLGPITSPR